MDPSEQIKPCSVQIVDLRKMKNKRSQLPNVTRLQDPNYVMRLPSSPPYTPDQIDDGTVWVKEEGQSPVMYDYDEMAYEDGEVSDEHMVYDMVYEDVREQYPGTMMPSTHPQANVENLPIESGPTIVPDSITSLQYKSLNFDPPLTHDLLAAIMTECYGIENPDVHTLTVLREQMEERPKLRIKLLEDLYTGNGKMKKKKKQKEQREVRQLVVPGNWAPYKPLTLAQATAHVAATKSNVGSRENGHEIVEARSHRTTPQPEYTIGEPSTSAGEAENSYVEQVYVNGTDTTPSADLRSTPPDVPRGNTPHTLSPSAAQDIKPDVPGTSPSVASPGTIQLAETSDTAPIAIYSPNTQTVTIPELPAGPPGALDVLIPVDHRGQMKAPYIGIPLNTCNIVHAPIKTENPSPQSESSPSASTSRPGSVKPDAAHSEPLPTGIIPIGAIPPGTIPPEAIPPGTKPVGIIPANICPPGLFPQAGVPPSGVPVGPAAPFAFPQGLGPFRIPIVRPQFPCTCPHPPTADQTRLPVPPGVPVPLTGIHPTVNVSGTENKQTFQLNLSNPPNPCTDRNTPSRDSCEVEKVRTVGSKHCDIDSTTPDLQPPHEDQMKHKLDSEQSTSVNMGSSSQANSKYFGDLPGSHLTVILPHSAQSDYKAGPPSVPSVTPVTTKAFAEDLALMWNEISSVKTEMRYIKTNVATEIHDLRNEMEDFMKLVGEKLDIPLSSWTHRNRKSNDLKRKEPDDDDEDDDDDDDDDVIEIGNVHKRVKLNDKINIT